jgi:hypothetical protein
MSVRWSTAIAKTLGQSTADVQAVLDANRPAPPATGSTPQQRRAKPDESALAKALGLDATKVKSALEAHRPDRP